MTKISENHLRKIVLEVILESAEAELEEKYGKMSRADAQKRLSTIEDKHGTSFESKKKAFAWADDPSAALAALMRKAGRNPRND